MGEALKTADLSIFKKHESNRQICPPNLRHLVESIRGCNMLSFRPIMVDSEMRVIDGQHRLEAAKILGLEIHYQIKEDAVNGDIILINFQKKWELEDYINYYCSLGNQEYMKIRDFSRETQLGYREICKLIKKTTGGKATLRIKHGNYRFFSKEDEQSVRELIKKREIVLIEINKYLIRKENFVCSSKMRCAVMEILKNSQCDLDVLISKIRLKADCIRPCVSVITYYTMLRDIYNWRNKNPIE